MFERICCISLVGIVLGGCTPSSKVEAPAPLPGPRYDFSPQGPCSPTGSTRLTIAVVSPLWQVTSQPSAAPGITPQAAGGMLFYEPKILMDVGPAMRSDFLELLSCRGYLAKGPFDSFESMVYPDREASQLLLEPGLQIDVDFSNLALEVKSMLGGLIKSRSSTARLSGTATVGGRVTLSLKEPLTNTRMWARSIEVPAESFQFITVHEYSSMMTPFQAKIAIMDDDGIRRELQPRLEKMYQNVLSVADSYLDRKELTTVAAQAMEVRKKAAIGVPKP